LWQLLHRLRSRGLREIHGDVIVDRGYFAPAIYDQGRFDNRPRRAYNVAPDALLVNFGAVDFTLVPEAGAVRVVAEPDLPNVQVTSRIRLAPERPLRRARARPHRHGRVRGHLFRSLRRAGVAARALRRPPLPRVDVP